MEKEKSKKKIGVIIEIIVLSLFIIGFAFLIIMQIVQPDLELSIWMKENILDVDTIGETIVKHIPVLITSLFWIAIIYAVSRILRIIFKARMDKSDRLKTVFSLLDGFVKYGCAIAIIILILQVLGVDPAALIASVGVLTLVVGLGAQPLIADIIAGIFIIFENEYNVGEIITINGFRGTVVEIGIRSTKILDAAGNIMIINNNSIGDVINLSRELSLAVVDFELPYTFPLEKMESILNDNFPKFKEKIPQIVEGPFYKGVCAYKESNIAVRVLAKVKEEDKYQVERDLLREYRLLLIANNVDVAFPQVVVSYANNEDVKVSAKEKRKANTFHETQKELSEGLEEINNN